MATTTARMQIWNAEADADLDESGLADVDLHSAIPAYTQFAPYYDGGMGMGMGMSGMDEATLLAAQQMIAQQAALAGIPDVVRRFITQFHTALQTSNLPEITLLYEQGWNRLTDKFYSKTEWPEAEIISPLVDDDPVFLILYRELYYRHVYSRLQPNIDDRFHSYENSCELFNYLLNSPSPPTLTLPDQYLWDIIDEFIYQFQSYALWRSRVKRIADEEISVLGREPPNGGVWSAYSVLNVLYSFIQKSRILEYLQLLREGQTEAEILEHGNLGEYAANSLYRMLGYFSLIGLLRVHTLLGDFVLALKAGEGVGGKLPPSFSRITAAQVSTSYYVGFCYMALRRYPDAIRTFVFILSYISRMKQYHTRSYQYDQINKTTDRLYALFAICHALAPSRVDDSVQSVAKEKWGEAIGRMMRSDDPLPAFEELYTYACPKFIAANSPPYHNIQLLADWVQNPPVEPAIHHLKIFKNDVQDRIAVRDLRSYLKLYTSLDARKLASYLGEGGAAAEEEMVQMLMVLKMSGRGVCRVGDDVLGGGGSRGATKGSSDGKDGSSSGGLLDGVVVKTSDVDFVIDDNIVHIVESTIGRRYAGWFIRNTEYAQRVLDGVKATPLPKHPLLSGIGNQQTPNINRGGNPSKGPASSRPTANGDKKSVSWAK